MCIACELGYWAMVDAIEADRASRGEGAHQSELVCDAPSEPPPAETATSEHKP